MVREKPNSSLSEVRNEALLWEMEDNRSHSIKGVKNYMVQSEPLKVQSSFTKSRKNPPSGLDEVQRVVAHQGEQLAELGKAMTALSAAAGKLCKHVQLTSPEPKVKSQSAFTHDAQPICFKCRGAGHIARKCPQVKPLPSDSAPVSPGVQEN